MKYIAKFTLHIFLFFFLISPLISQAGRENVSSHFSDGRPELVDLIKNLTPSVVSISTERNNQAASSDGQRVHNASNQGLSHGTGPLTTFETDSIGSGFFCDNRGHIVTNAHVVEGAEKIFVTLASGKVMNAEIVARHPRVDLALLKIDPPVGVREAFLGKSENVQVGEWVLAVGNPFGLGRTVTVGIVSGKGRFLGFGPDDDFIQTDASINPGNSGGPLFNMAGEVIGVNTAIISTGKGIGFSIPSNFIKELIQLPGISKHHGHGWLGVYIDEPEGSRNFPTTVKSPRGAIIDEVMRATPAEKAGLRRGDVIISAGEKPIENSRDLSDVVSGVKPGNTLLLTVLRGKETHRLEVVLGQTPQ